ncbi:MAG: phosphoribosylanthranilate isomerase [Planctomycetaceae bacterium]|nr:phosphoribosylanthranilate isomerase [Planctomycetaceae bacterium]
MWIKICGIRDVETARAVADCGADAIGLNFYASSPRHVTEPTAAQIVSALPPHVIPVGVFVNHSQEEILQACDACGIAAVQLHGDEPVSLLSELPGLRVIRALRVRRNYSEVAVQEITEYGQCGASPWAWLVDARVDDLYGGSGQTLDWEHLAATPHLVDEPPLILAGGLTAENVARAVQLVQPWGVDVASGVESTPGVKNLRSVERFVRAARDAS